MSNRASYGHLTMTRLRHLAIRYFLYDRILSGKIVDRFAFRSAVNLYRKWFPDAPVTDARNAVSNIVLDIIHDDPSCFWRDAGGNRSHNAAVT